MGILKNENVKKLKSFKMIMTFILLISMIMTLVFSVSAKAENKYYSYYYSSNGGKSYEDSTGVNNYGSITGATYPSLGKLKENKKVLIDSKGSAEATSVKNLNDLKKLEKGTTNQWKVYKVTNNITLDANITVPVYICLLIAKDTTINLNGNYLKLNSYTIIQGEDNDSSTIKNANCSLGYGGITTLNNDDYRNQQVAITNLKILNEKGNYAVKLSATYSSIIGCKIALSNNNSNYGAVTFLTKCENIVLQDDRINSENPNSIYCGANNSISLMKIGISNKKYNYESGNLNSRCIFKNIKLYNPTNVYIGNGEEEVLTYIGGNIELFNPKNITLGRIQTGTNTEIKFKNISNDSSVGNIYVTSYGNYSSTTSGVGMMFYCDTDKSNGINGVKIINSTLGASFPKLNFYKCKNFTVHSSKMPSRFTACKIGISNSECFLVRYCNFIKSTSITNSNNFQISSSKVLYGNGDTKGITNCKNFVLDKIFINASDGKNKLTITNSNNYKINSGCRYSNKSRFYSNSTCSGYENLSRKITSTAMENL